MKLNLVKLLLPLSDVPASLADALFNGKGAVFEEALRQACCTRNVCVPEPCDGFTSCPIPGLVSRNVSPDPDLLKKHQKPGLPYVFRKQGDRHQFSLILLGNAIAHLSLFLEVLVLRSDNHTPYPVVARDGQNSPVAITFDGEGNAENLPLLEAHELIDHSCADFHACQRVRIDLETPLRMVRDGHELNRFDPVFFLRSLLRRLSSLAAYYGEGVDTDHFRYLAGLAGEVRLLRQAVVRDTASHRGISGSYELQGPFAELGPLLCLGGLVNLGKGASYGQGAFDLTPIP